MGFAEARMIADDPRRRDGDSMSSILTVMW
jgi:hypothetical protein